MIDVNLLFEQVELEEQHIAEFNRQLHTLDEKIRKICTIRPTDSKRKMRKKCKVAKKYGVTYAPVWNLAMTQPVPIPTGTDGGTDAAPSAVAEQRKRTVQFLPPNVEVEWPEAQQYSEFKDKGKWETAIRNAEPQMWSALGTVANFQSDLEELNPEKIKRVASHIKSGKVEMPIVGMWTDGEYELISGNTRIALLLRLGIDPQVLVVKFPTKKPAKRPEKPTPAKKPSAPKRKRTRVKKKAPTRVKHGRKPEPPKSSTERVRRYYKRHPDKVKKYLRKTQDDRVTRNRDRRKAIDKYGKKKMKNHDVHHPNGTNGGKWKLAKKDHGPDKLDEVYTPQTIVSYEHLLHPVKDAHITFGDIKELISLGLGHGIDLSSAAINPKDDAKYVAFDEQTLTAMDGIKTKYIAELQKFQEQYGLTDDSSMVEYKSAWWNKKLEFDSIPMLGTDKELLVNRWGKGDKSHRLMNLSSPELIAWARNVEESLGVFEAKAMQPLHNFLTRLTVESVKRSIDLLSKHNPFLAEKATERLVSVMKGVRSEQINDAVQKMNRYMEQVDAAGLKSITPADGLTFSYKGNLYKYTGPFSPMKKLVGDITSFIPQEATDAPAPTIIRKVMTIKEREAAANVMKRTIVNPKTKNMISVRDALKLPTTHPAYISANTLVKRSMLSEAIIPFDNESKKFTKVPREVAETTAERVLDMVNLSNVRHQLVGSIDQKLMNDIDIAMDVNELKNVIRYDDSEDLFGQIEKHIGNSGLEAVYLPQYNKITLESPLIDSNGGVLPAYDKTGEPINKPSLAKIDIMLGDLDWMSRFLVNGDTSQYKPEYRNILIDTVLNSGMFDTSDDLIKYKFDVSTRNGLYKVVITHDESGEVVNKESTLLSNDVDMVAKEMFGRDTEFSQIDTFEKLLDMLQTEDSPYKNIMSDVLARYVKKLENKHLPTPDKLTNVKAEPAKISRRPIVAFPGKFQPYHSGHQAIYDELVRKFGKGNVYVITDRGTESGVAPFTLAQKMNIMTDMFGIPEDNIIVAKDMFNPIELTSQFPETTPVVMAATGDEFEARSSELFKPYGKGDVTDGHNDAIYTIRTPEPRVNINGKQITGQQLIDMLGNPKITDRAKQEIFTKAYKKFDKSIFDKVTKTAMKAGEEKRLTTDYAPTPRTPAEEEPTNKRQPAVQQDQAAVDRELYGQGEVWTTESGRYGAKNSKGKIAYFKTPEAAENFSMK